MPVRYDPRKHHRQTQRLQGYDYTIPGAYFITMQTFRRKRLFGDVVDRQMVLSPIGRTVEECWLAIPLHFSRVTLDAFVVMPDHFHGILILEERGSCESCQETGCNNLNSCGEPFQPCEKPGCNIIYFCGDTACRVPTKEGCNSSRSPHFDQGVPTKEGCNSSRSPAGLQLPVPQFEQFSKPVPGSVSTIIRSFKSAVTRKANLTRVLTREPLWQSRFYEHIVRNPKALNRIRRYIVNNPARWQETSK